MKVIGLSLPNDNKRYVHEGITECVVLWNTMDLGYLTVHAARALKQGTLKPGVADFAAGRLGKITVAGDNLLLGTPFAFTKENIEAHGPMSRMTPGFVARAKQLSYCWEPE